MFRGSASAIVLVYLFFSSMLQLAVSSQSTGWKASKLSARDVQHSRHHLTSHHNMARSFQSNLRQRADVPELLDPDDRLHRFYARSTNQRRQNLTFEFDRHDGRSYVRFILAGSVVDGKDSKPVVISQKDVCTTGSGLIPRSVC